MSRPERSRIADERRLDRLVEANPAEAIVEARSWLGASPQEDATAAIAQSAIGRSLFELGEMSEATASMHTALERARRTGDGALRVRVTMSAAAIMAEAGSVDAARDALIEIAPEIDDDQIGRYETQRSFVEYHAGRLTLAMEHSARAEPALRAAGDDLGLLRLLIHRGVILLQQGRLPHAGREFDEASVLAVELGSQVAQAVVAANQAVVLGRSRRIPESLRMFEHAAGLYRVAGEPGRSMSVLEIDRAEVLMHAGLLVDAVDAAGRAVALVESSGNQVFVGDACLVLARALLARGSHAEAVRASARSEHLLDVAGRPNMVAQARAIRICALLDQARTGDDAAVPLATAAAIVDELESDGWMDTANEVRLARVRCGRRTGHAGVIAQDVGSLAARRFDEHRNIALAGWFAEAVEREGAGEHVDAYSACRAGLTLVDEIAAEATSLAERSAAMRTGADLSGLAIAIAVARGDADTVLAAAEGTRARALHDELADMQRHRPLTLEGAVRLRDELSTRLGDRSLVEWLLVDDRVWAVVFDAAGSRLVDVSSRKQVVRASDRVGMWLDIAVAEPDGSSERASVATRRLDGLLVDPLGLPPDAGVVMVPTDVLHGIPWAGMPSLAGRPLTIAPSAQLWLEAERRTARSARSVGLVAGPEVTGSATERAAVERSYPSVVTATDDGAVASSVRSMLTDADVVHLAAHGTFRSDHPLLSMLRLADGETTLYDAFPERVTSQLVVLSSCEGGAQGTADGSEVLGLSSVLLGRGAAAVLAPLTRVRELECAEFVAEVHGELAAGESIACAVAAVRRRWLADDDLSRWAVASSFTCFGSGAVTVSTA